jgi:hypothetical protein
MKIVDNLLRFFSGGRIAPAVRVGQRWCLDSQTKNPYDRNMYTVIVKDTRNGWVRWEHAIDPHSTGTDTINHFRWLYDLLPEEKEEYLHCGHPKTSAIRYPGNKPYCSICREFVEEKDRAEFAKWHDEHIKPMLDAMEESRRRLIELIEKNR